MPYRPPQIPVGSVALAMLLALLATPALAQHEPVNLQPHWREGQTARYDLWTQRSRETTMSMAGRTRTSNLTTTTTGELTWTVNRVHPSGGATCTMTLDWLAMVINPDEGQPQSNDSRKGSGDNPPIYNLLKAMAGVPITVEVNADGSIASVSGTDAIRRQVEMKELVPEDLDFIESASDMATIASAPEMAAIGESWKAAFRWSHEMGHLRHNMTYTLASVEEVAEIPVANVVGEGTLALDVDRSKLPPDSPPIDVRLIDGRVSTQIMFDLVRHEAVGRNSSQQTTIEVTVKLPQQSLTQRTVETIQGQTLRIEED